MHSCCDITPGQASRTLTLPAPALLQMHIHIGRISANKSLPLARVLRSGDLNGRRLKRPVQVQSSSNGSSSSSGNTVLVDGLVVQPAYRSTPWEAEQLKAQQANDKAQIMFVSESGICRGPLAAALFRHMLADSPLRGWVDVHVRASRDYCIGQQPHPAADAVAQAALGAPLAGAAADGAAESAAAAAGGAVQFDPAADIVASDLVLVMDKYTAADVLREVSSYDLINPGGYYSARVRVLGSFHPVLGKRNSLTDAQDIDDPLYGNTGGQKEQRNSLTDAQDIDDPLYVYGNTGGQKEQDAVLLAAKLIHESCAALLQQLEGLAAEQGLLDDEAVAAAVAAIASGSSDSSSGADAAAAAGEDASLQLSPGARFRQALVGRIREEGVISWLVPPMLQGANTQDLGGWV
ncbi:hypothetical protein OEZ86_008786 [Tetradesmus obliquus]|nr:hypothetical protein OEZ86_008786 [Tetradesmus obliquus]